MSSEDRSCATCKNYYDCMEKIGTGYDANECKQYYEESNHSLR